MREIAEWTGLGRQAVQTAVKQLTDVTLLRKASRYETVAIEPTGSTATWWAKRPPKGNAVAAHWADSLAFFQVIVSDGPVLESVLLGLVRSLARKTKVAKSQCYLGLARMLGCKDYRTVKAALNSLVEAKKIEIEGVRENRFKKTDRFDVILQDLKEAGGTKCIGSLPSTSVVIEAKSPHGDLADPSMKPMTPRERIRHDKECMKRMMQNSGYPEHVTGTVLGLTDKLPIDNTFDIFLANFSFAQEDHQMQQSQGKFQNVRHSGHLLIHNLDKVVEKRKEAERSWAKQMADYESMTVCV